MHDAGAGGIGPVWKDGRPESITIFVSLYTCILPHIVVDRISASKFFLNKQFLTLTIINISKWIDIYSQPFYIVNLYAFNIGSVDPITRWETSLTFMCVPISNH